MKVLILAAGYGTRLYPITLDKPKALLEVGGKTILERIITSIIEVNDCDHIYIVTNSKFYKDFVKWVINKNFSMEITVIDDGTSSNEARLGAIGDIHLVIEGKNISEDLLVAGSDNLFDFDVKDFIAFAKPKSPCASIALFDIKDLKKANLYGIAVINKETYEVIGFEEKPAKPKSTLAATAVYFYPKEKLKLFSEYIKAGLTKDAPGNFIKWLVTKEPVYGYVFKGNWYDIGSIESLKKADEDYRKRGK